MCQAEKNLKSGSKVIDKKLLGLGFLFCFLCFFLYVLLLRFWEFLHKKQVNVAIVSTDNSAASARLQSVTTVMEIRTVRSLTVNPAGMESANPYALSVTGHSYSSLFYHIE